MDISFNIENSNNKKLREFKQKKDEEVIFNKKLNNSLVGRILISKCSKNISVDIEKWLIDVQTKKTVAFNKKYSKKLFNEDNSLILNKEDLSYISCLTIINILAKSQETTVEYICREVGKVINNELMIRHFEIFHKDYLNKLNKNIEKDQKLKNILITENIFKYNENLKTDNFIHLNHIEKVKIGLLFFSIFKKNNYEVLSEGYSPFFINEKENINNQITEKIKTTYLFNDWLKKSISFLNQEVFEYKPTEYKPKDWENIEQGGYFKTPNKLNKRDCQEFKKEVKKENLTELFKTLNIVQNSKFEIHNETFNVLDYFYKNEIALKKDDGTDIIPDFKRIDIEKTDEIKKSLEILKIQKKMYKNFETNSKIIKAFNKNNKEDIKIGRKYKETVKRQMIKECSNKSKLNSYSNITNNTTRKLLNKSFYLPIQLDHRSRMYYKPALNPQKDDLIKGVLCFSKKEKISLDFEKNEIKEFFIQGANSFGKDNLNHKNKIDFILNNIEEILNVVKNPLSKKAFWLKADKPVLFLQFCFEFRKYINAVAENKAYFETNIIRYSDGKANGLQHLSAMSLDENAGKLTAIIDEDVDLEDIYMAVAKKTNIILKEYIENEKDYDLNFTEKDLLLLKKWLNFKVERDLAKKNVMTFSFNSTLSGRTKQIIKFLNERDLSNKVPIFEYFEYKRASLILAKIIEKACYLVFPKLMNLINKIVELISVFCKYIKNKPLILKTPYFNYPVVHKYNRKKGKAVRIASKGVSFSIYTEEETDIIDIQKMKTAIIANLIQMLDPTHLFLSVREMSKRNAEKELSFSLIHDDYGISPKYSHEFNIVIREMFLKLYNENCPFSMLKKAIKENGEEYYNEMLLGLTETHKIKDNLIDLINDKDETKTVKISKIKKDYNNFIKELSDVCIEKGSLDILRVVYSNRFFD